MIFGRLGDRWDVVGETEQQAVINFENGREKMILSVGWEETAGEGVVWVFPLPAPPEQISLDLVRKFPRLGGEEVFSKARFELSEIRKLLLRTQIYPIPFIAITEVVFGVNTLNFVTPSYSGAGASEYVAVHEHLEKEGVASEIITTKNAAALYDYFQNKGLKIEPGAVEVLQGYIGKDYSFVASWITSSAEESDNVRGVYVSFPTEEVYYPLLPTSVYGERVVPTTIRVLGFVTPKVPESIQGQTQTRYYLQEFLDIEGETSKFFSDKGYFSNLRQVKYTLVRINSPARQFTEDLWLIPQAPEKVRLAANIGQHSKMIGLLLLVAISSSLSLVLGILVFEEARNLKGMGKFLLIGLTNSLTLLALIVAVWFMTIRRGGDINSHTIKRLKEGGYFLRRRLAAIVLVLSSPLVAFTVLASPFLLTSLFDRYFFTNVVLVVMLPSAGLVYLCQKLKTIKPEDQSLFEELKALKYSSWTFQPEDSRRKLAFVTLFALLFPIIVLWVTFDLEFVQL